MQLRKTLARCHQNDKSVAEYAHELTDLFNMIGKIPMQERVIKFWNSARPSIQRELWRNKLNPELSTWNKVVSQAEIIEIAENVAERHGWDRRTNPPSTAPGMVSGSSGGNSKNKGRPTDGSVQAVSFGSRVKKHGKHRNNPFSNQERQRQGSNHRPRDGTHARKGSSKNGSVPPNGSHNNKFHARKTRQLSDKEKAEYRADGRCFGCGKEGHISRNCPDNATVKSHGQGPPGASTFNVEPIPLETDSDEQAEVLDSLPLGAMFFGDSEKLTSGRPWPLDEWRMHYPYWNEPNILARENIGNCYTMVADSILTLEPPFPGDELYFAENIRPELRFHVLQRPRAPFDFVIEDRLTDTKSIISQHRLKDPNFDISYWYAEQRNKELRLTGEITHHREMGDAISIVATKLLTDGIASSFPSTSYQLAPGHRFRIYRSDRGNRLEEYIIEDADLGENTNVPKTWLEDPTFDLVGWYRLYLGRRGFFEHQYHEKQSRTYRKEEVVIPSNGKGPDSTNQPDLPPSLSAGEPTANPADWDKLPEFEVLTADGSDFESEEFFEEENLNQGSDLEDLPGLDPLSDDSDDEVAADDCHIYVSEEEEEKILVERIKTVLTQCQPFPGDGPPIDISYKEGDQRFAIELRARGLYCVYDRVQGFEADIHVARLRWEFFSIGKWYAERCATNAQLDEPWICAHQWLLTREWEDTVMGLTSDSQSQFNGPITQETAEGKVELGGIQVDKHKYPALQRNSAQVKGNQRILPKPIVVKVTVNGHPA